MTETTSTSDAGANGSAPQPRPPRIGRQHRARTPRRRGIGSAATRANGAAATAPAGSGKASDAAAVDTAGGPAVSGNTPSKRYQTIQRAALVLTVGVAVLVLVTLPFAVRSMAAELIGGPQFTRYDLLAGGTVADAAEPEVDPAEVNQRSYFNVAAVALDEVAGSVTLAISGNRECDPCLTANVRILALDDDAAVRRGLPPSALVTLEPDELVFSESVTLPVRGRPNLYPFDQYEIWLGFDISLTAPDGTIVRLDLPTLEQRLTITLQNQVPQLTMDPPRTIEGSRVAAATDPFALPVVEELRFVRPVYVQILAVLLVLLISVSGGIALMTREINDLLLGVGGLILGVWGIRSVLVNQPLPGGSAVDLALTFVILFLLLGLVVRLTRHFHRGSGLELHWPRGRLAWPPVRTSSAATGVGVDAEDERGVSDARAIPPKAKPPYP